MKYPNDFKVFEGKRLSSEEINDLIQETLEDAQEVEPSEFDTLLASSSTGDIKVEIEEFGYIAVWQLMANYWPQKIEEGE